MSELIVRFRKLRLVSLTVSCFTFLLWMNVCGAGIVLATGGTVTNYVDGEGISWRAHIFTDTVTNTLTIFQDINVEYLVVAGGGTGGTGGGRGGGGGGGAGGYRKFVDAEANNTAAEPLSISFGSYSIVVGDAGQDSSLDLLLTALAGGDGGDGFSSDTLFGKDGGCGGGGAGGTSSDDRSGGIGVQGGDGGRGNSNNAIAGARSGAGGGGATGDGTNGTNDVGGEGGPGLSTTISGVLETYCEGGRGMRRNSDPRLEHPTAGGVNTGSGGDGTEREGGDGKPGGSGIVIIRYVVPQAGSVIKIR